MGEAPRRLHDISGANALSEFRSEGDPVEAPPAPEPRRLETPPPVARVTPAVAVPARKAGYNRTRWWGVAAALGAAAVVAATFFFLLPVVRRSATNTQGPETRPGQVTLDTVPAGFQVLVAGQLRGITPLTIPLPAGHHNIVLRRGTDERTIPLDMTAGAEIIQRVEFAAAPSSASKLTIATEPSGARVAIDGETRGVSPLTVADLSVGRHRVSVTGPGGASERLVTTEAGTTTSVVFALSKAGRLDTGWLTVTSPFEVSVKERDETIGTSASSKIIVPSGSHELDFVNAGLGFENHRKVDIESGKTAVVRLDARSALNVNARPWAEVTIDGTSAGVTPIANQVVTLGSHQVIFRHPNLGERRETIVVTQQGPNRLSIDMTK